MMPSLQVMLAMSNDAWFLKAFMRIPLDGDLERSIFFQSLTLFSRLVTN